MESVSQCIRVEYCKTAIRTNTQLQYYTALLLQVRSYYIRMDR
jgi:hypothetical protein